MNDPITDILSHFHHEHLPPRLAAVSRRVGDVARDLAAGAPELATIRIVAAAHELYHALPPGPEKAEGLDLLADASVGLPGEPETELRTLAAGAAAEVPVPPDPDLYARLRTLLRAKDALVRAEVSRPTSAQAIAPNDRGHGMLHDQRREG